jgi:hypothetical protein
MPDHQHETRGLPVNHHQICAGVDAAIAAQSSSTIPVDEGGGFAGRVHAGYWLGTTRAIGEVVAQATPAIVGHDSLVARGQYRSVLACCYEHTTC